MSSSLSDPDTNGDNGAQRVLFAATPSHNNEVQNSNAQCEFVDSELDLSDDSEDEIDQRLSGEEVTSVIGVSIGREQSRYRSPNTPAAERTQVLTDSKDAPGIDPEDIVIPEVHKRTTESPTRAADNGSTSARQRSGAIPAPLSLKGGLREREPWRADTVDQTLPRLPQHISPLHTRDATSVRGSVIPLRGERPGSLRRVNSDNSLYLRRTLSGTSTLEDVARWDHVQEQVNSRFKAIKDSFQDSTLRNLPKIPSVDLSALKSPFIRTESGHGAQMQRDQLSDQTLRSPYNSSESAIQQSYSVVNQSMSTSKKPNENTSYPSLNQALKDFSGDVVVLGGYRGSILRSAKPPHMQVWAPVKIGLNLRKVDLEVGLRDEDEETMEERIIPSGTLSHIGPIDICRRLLKKLRKSENAKTGTLRVHDYGYDWRLSPKLLVQKLIQYLETLECNQSSTPRHLRGAIVIAHSLGGLLVRSAVNQRPELFAGVLYAGVPQHCVNILGPLRNGDDVLFSSRVLTAQVNFTLRTSFALMPESGICFFNRATKERYDVDFFDAKTWEEYRLTPCLRPPLPPYRDQESRKGFIDTVSSSIASLPKRASFALPHESASRGRSTSAGQRSKEDVEETVKQMDNAALEPTMSSSGGQPWSSSSVATRVTISRDDAFEYLSRTLSSVLEFKRSAYFVPEHESANEYPPAAVLYGKSVPTLYGARVASREAIKHSDAYDDLAFAAGDGVVLAKAAMLPEGYRVVKNGLVRSERGHVGLLGDLEGVGRCLLAILDGRRKGVGLGLDDPGV
ncbi:hypothetical protein UCRPC4_g05296 [Phaeomoniella chlamydospora]|uniref:Uncharacterized protein n=1 Tax=Phaeomoniella chlamydospora TaxID=158046 RepID=A0A0G2E5G2_PHACM|nr:hypothetical protein UCRPC4_g05296 [Phaeomoniella chlamydospora]